MLYLVIRLIKEVEKMKVDDFVSAMKRVARFKIKLTREGIVGMEQQIILKIYLNDLIPKINTKLLGVI